MRARTMITTRLDTCRRRKRNDGIYSVYGGLDALSFKGCALDKAQPRLEHASEARKVEWSFMRQGGIISPKARVRCNRATNRTALHT